MTGLKKLEHWRLAAGACDLRHYELQAGYSGTFWLLLREWRRGGTREPANAAAAYFAGVDWTDPDNRTPWNPHWCRSCGTPPGDHDALVSAAVELFAAEFGVPS